LPSLDWQRFCDGANLTVDGQNRILVSLPGQRRHRVRVADEADCLVLSAMVARAAILEAVDRPILWAWRRNRGTRLVGFRLDARDALIGEARVPKAGISGEEFRTYVNAVARECDRFEYLLTGQDRE